MSQSAYTLIGVAVGAGLTGTLGWLNARVAHKREIAERRRGERLQIISEFLRHVEDLWSAQQDLTYVVIEIVASQIKSTPEQERQRQEAFARIVPAQNAAKLLVQQMKLVLPELAPSAGVLITRSRQYREPRLQEDAQDRADALESFETSAQKLVAAL